MEDQEGRGSGGTAGSHWERRVFGNEYMTGECVVRFFFFGCCIVPFCSKKPMFCLSSKFEATTHFRPVVSDLTLAFLRGSGLYRVTPNFVRSSSHNATVDIYPFTFGHNQSCSFIAPRCDAWRGAYQCGVSDRAARGCVWDRSGLGKCTILSYG